MAADRCITLLRDSKELKNNKEVAIPAQVLQAMLSSVEGSMMSRTCKSASTFFKPAKQAASLSLRELFDHVGKGDIEQSKVVLEMSELKQSEAILLDPNELKRSKAISPDHSAFLLLTMKASFTDPYGRHFDKITPFQYAVWARDWRMWDMMMDCFSMHHAKDLAKSQIEELESKGVGHGTQCDFSPLIESLQTFKNSFSFVKYHPVGGDSRLARLAQQALTRSVAHLESSLKCASYVSQIDDMSYVSDDLEHITSLAEKYKKLKEHCAGVLVVNNDAANLSRSWCRIM
jgi:hypothetical protein